MISNLFAIGGKTNFDDIKAFVHHHINYINKPKDNNNEKENNQNDEEESYNKFVNILSDEFKRSDIKENMKDPSFKKKSKEEQDRIRENQKEFSEKTEIKERRIYYKIKTQVKNLQG